MKPFIVTALVLAFAGSLAGCTPSKRPFLMVEVCLSKSGNLPSFVDEMRIIAKSDHSVFIDTSEETQRGLERIGAYDSHKPNAQPVVNMGIERRNGSGLMVGNLNLPNYQLVVGFSEGKDAADARRFAENVIETLRQHWRVETVPPGEGAKGMKSCE